MRKLQNIFMNKKWSARGMSVNYIAIDKNKQFLFNMLYCGQRIEFFFFICIWINQWISENLSFSPVSLKDVFCLIYLNFNSLSNYPWTHLPFFHFLYCDMKHGHLPSSFRSITTWFLSWDEIMEIANIQVCITKNTRKIHTFVHSHSQNLL